MIRPLRRVLLPLAIVASLTFASADVGAQKSSSGHSGSSSKSGSKSSGTKSKTTSAKPAKAPKEPKAMAAPTSKTKAAPKSKTMPIVEPRGSHPASYCTTCARDSKGRILRGSAAKSAFEKETGYPHGRKGYVIDHVVALACGGSDNTANMQWQTIADAKAKDRTERKGCR